MDYLSNLNTLQKSLEPETNSSDSSKPEKKDYFSDMEDFMNKTVVNMYSRNWGRLEKKLKINKLNEYILRVVDENNFNQQKKEDLTGFLMNLLSTNKINKATELKYDKENCEIVEILGLKFKQNDFEYKTKKK
tara:strand:+ start:21 stop:419 length:399 start_codon:yes stop_codon:yes gene_type:complete